MIILFNCSSEDKIQYSSLDITEKLLKIYNATIAPVITKQTTHVIVDPDDTSRLKSIVMYIEKHMPEKNIFIVSKEWVSESIKSREELDEAAFGLKVLQGYTNTSSICTLSASLNFD